MQISRISCINFFGKIIDSHAHVGSLQNVTYSKSDLDIFVKSDLPNNDTIEKMFVSDLDVLNSLKDEYGGNKVILEIFKDSPKYEFLHQLILKAEVLIILKNFLKKIPANLLALNFILICKNWNYRIRSMNLI